MTFPHLIAGPYSWGNKLEAVVFETFGDACTALAMFSHQPFCMEDIKFRVDMPWIKIVSQFCLHRGEQFGYTIEYTDENSFCRYLKQA